MDVRSGDVLAHFKGVCAFLKTHVQHASHQKEETIYYPCRVFKNVVMFKDREVIREHLVWSGFIWIITLSGLSTVRHNRGQKAS
jgi:hemerythrin-like domain-containing protein